MIAVIDEVGLTSVCAVVVDEIAVIEEVGLRSCFCTILILVIDEIGLTSITAVLIVVIDEFGLNSVCTFVIFVIGDVVDADLAPDKTRESHRQPVNVGRQLTGATIWTCLVTCVIVAFI